MPTFCGETPTSPKGPGPVSFQGGALSKCPGPCFLGEKRVLASVVLGGRVQQGELGGLASPNQRAALPTTHRVGHPPSTGRSQGWLQAPACPFHPSGPSWLQGACGAERSLSPGLHNARLFPQPHPALPFTPSRCPALGQSSPLPPHHPPSVSHYCELLPFSACEPLLPAPALVPAGQAELGK